MSTAKLSPLFYILQGMLESDTIDIDGEPYLTRFYVAGKNARTIGEKGQVFIHFFHKSDQGRELHNHPYIGTSIMLSGGYREEVLTEHTDALGRKTYSEVSTNDFLPGDIHTLNLGDFHRAELLDPEHGAWTVFVTGERVKAWGFIDRHTHVYYPYKSKDDEREGNGPHSRTNQVEREVISSRSVRTSVPSRFEVGQRVWLNPEYPGDHLVGAGTVTELDTTDLNQPVGVELDSDMDPGSVWPLATHVMSYIDVVDAEECACGCGQPLPRGHEDVVDAEFSDAHAEETESFVPALRLGQLVTTSWDQETIREVVEIDEEDRHLTYRIRPIDQETGIRYGTWAAIEDLDIYLVPQAPEQDVNDLYEPPVKRSFFARLADAFL